MKLKEIEKIWHDIYNEDLKSKVVNIVNPVSKQKEKMKTLMNAIKKSQMVDEFSTIEKCILRDLLKIEIKKLEKIADKNYLKRLLKIGRKLKLTQQQRNKMNKLYNKKLGGM